MSFISEEIMDYAEMHTNDEPKLLQELRKETWQKVIAPRMLSGHFQGRLLAMISKMIQPKKILEIGTFTGYATLCLAEGLTDNGTIFTIDINEELEEIQQKYFKKSGYAQQIVLLTGNALELIPRLTEGFDLVFIDADKENYSQYFELIIDKMNKGGIVLSDNVLWSGKVLNNAVKNDKDTQSLILYNQLLKDESKVETILLPIRDGISITRKL
ncbi:MAG TPA: O-methyltransferase [Lutibacter sp.]|nr:O-methyltransferase [Lutibacter sp.]